MAGATGKSAAERKAAEIASGLASAGSAVAVLAYPAAVYYGLRYHGARDVGLLLLGAVLMGLSLKWRLSGRRFRDVAAVPLATAFLLGLSALLRDSRFMLAVPVMVNAVLLGMFAGSLRTERPMVERFARLHRPDLSPQEVRYCRTVTVVWCVFFAVNGAIAAVLALAAPVGWWAVYTGIIGYVLIGVLFTVEYLVRKWRFRQYGSALHDRLISLLFPPPQEP